MKYPLDNLVKALERLGLKGYESQAYIALLKLKEATASEIASSSGVPQPRIYDVLESLARRGLIEYSVERPRKYRALPPASAIPLLVKKHIRELSETGRIISEELNRLFNMEHEGKGPNLWISHNVEVGLNKVKTILKKAKEEVVIAVNRKIYRRIIRTVARKASRNSTRVYAVTVYAHSREVPFSRKIRSVPNLLVKYLPTGNVNIILVDASRFLLLMDNYVLDVNEHGLFSMAEEFYYHSVWRIAHWIKEPIVSKGQVYNLKKHWLALEVIKKALEKGLKVKAKVKGIKVKDKSPIEVEGMVKNVTFDVKDSIRSFTLKLSDGSEVTIGGYRAVIEDIEAVDIRLEIM